jgi:hypothetical protein
VVWQQAKNLPAEIRATLGSDLVFVWQLPVTTGFISYICWLLAKNKKLTRDYQHNFVCLFFYTSN